ncbi:MAG: FtsB family cell division protein [Eubacteriales bacterium]|jgi:cell division protein FtsB
MKKHKYSNIFIKAAVLAFVSFCAVTIIKLQFDFNELRRQRDELQAIIEEQEEYNEGLAERLNSPFDKDYIISIAREKLGYCMPDEIIFYNDK